MLPAEGDGKVLATSFGVSLLCELFETQRWNMGKQTDSGHFEDPLVWSFNDLGLVITRPYSRPPILSLFGCETPSLPLPAGLVGSKALGCVGEECSAGEEPGNLYLEDCDSGGQLVLWVVGEAWRRCLTLV